MSTTPAKVKKPLAVGQINQYGNEILKINAKTIDVAFAHKNVKGMRLDTMKGTLFTLPKPDGRWVLRQRKDELTHCVWRTPRTIQTDPTMAFRPSTSQYETYKDILDAGTAGIATTTLTANQKRIGRELEKLGYVSSRTDEQRSKFYFVDETCKTLVRH